MYFIKSSVLGPWENHPLPLKKVEWNRLHQSWALSLWKQYFKFLPIEANLQLQEEV